MYAVAVAAGGSEKKDSEARLSKLVPDPAKAGTDISQETLGLLQAQTELAQSRTVKLSQITTRPATARFNLVFDSSPRPERADFAEGDESLRQAAAQLREKDFPIRFPDVSSIKIIRQAKLTCTPSACTIELLPIDK